jgi:hypothetical protein
MLNSLYWLQICITITFDLIWFFDVWTKAYPMMSINDLFFYHLIIITITIMKQRGAQVNNILLILHTTKDC